MDALRRRRSDLETGRGWYANHPLNRAVLDQQQTEASVARLTGNLAGRRLPRRGRRQKEAELARWRARQAATARALGDLVTPERRRLDSAEPNVTGQLSHLNEQRAQRDAWFARNPKVARRLNGIELDIETLDALAERAAPAVNLGRGASRNWHGLRRVPVAERGLDIGLGR